MAALLFSLIWYSNYSFYFHIYFKALQIGIALRDEFGMYSIILKFYVGLNLWLRQQFRSKFFIMMLRLAMRFYLSLPRTFL